MSPAAPDCSTATETGIIPATSTTVVQEMARYACFMVRTRLEHHRAGGEHRRHRRSHDTRGEHDDHRQEDHQGAARPGPHRHRLATNGGGLIDDEDLTTGLETPLQPIPGPLQQHRVPHRQTGGLEAEVLALALDGQDDEVSAAGRPSRGRRALRRSPTAVGSPPRRHRPRGRSGGDSPLNAQGAAGQPVSGGEVVDLLRRAAHGEDRPARHRGGQVDAPDPPGHVDDAQIGVIRAGQVDRQPGQPAATPDPARDVPATHPVRTGESASGRARRGREGSSPAPDRAGDAARTRGRSPPPRSRPAPHQTEVEITETRLAGLDCSVGHEDVDRRAGQRQE